jgi:hypothetical protein
MQNHKLKINVIVLVMFLTLNSLGTTLGFCFLTRDKKPTSKQEAKLPSTSPFKIDEKIPYQVRFNGVKVGKIELEYKGRQKLGKDLVDILVVSSCIRILALFEIESREKVYVDVNMHLPIKVEREVKFLGKQEVISEEYNQEEGWLKLTQTKGKTTEEKLIKVSPPIHNVLILYFLYPLDLKDEAIGKTYEFNLPTRKISIKLKEARKISRYDKEIEEFYIWEGSPRRFEVWLKKTERLPWRVEIPAFLGRIVITRI